MNLKDAYHHYLKQLKPIYSDNEAAAITGWVFERVVNVTRSDLISSPLKELGADVMKDLDNKFFQLLQHRPVQYVLEEAWFCKMKLKVNEHVLIPRPETEELVGLVVSSFQSAVGNSSQLAAQSPQLTLLDIGTGSGCIAIALKKALPQLVITAIDVSEDALEVAKRNAADQYTAIDFKQLNFLDESSWNSLPVFDIIVSNPPYIPMNEREGLDKNVANWEPPGALFVPDNSPLLFYEKIAAFGKTNVATGGKIFLEMHEQYARQVEVLFSQHYNNVEIKKDVFEKERMLLAY